MFVEAAEAETVKEWEGLGVREAVGLAAGIRRQGTLSAEVAGTADADQETQWAAEPFLRPSLVETGLGYL